MRFEPLTVSHRVVRGPPARAPRTVMTAVALPCGYCGVLREMRPLNSDLSAKKRKGLTVCQKILSRILCVVYTYLLREDFNLLFLSYGYP